MPTFNRVGADAHFALRLGSGDQKKLPEVHAKKSPLRKRATKTPRRPANSTGKWRRPKGGGGGGWGNLNQGPPRALPLTPSSSCRTHPIPDERKQQPTHRKVGHGAELPTPLSMRSCVMSPLLFLSTTPSRRLDWPRQLHQLQTRRGRPALGHAAL
jgi:hypothetical protein